MGRYMRILFCFAYRKLKLPTEKPSGGPLSNALSQPAHLESALEVNQTVNEREGDDIAVHAIKCTLPALHPGVWSP
jgi:hypothetical protein